MGNVPVWLVVLVWLSSKYTRSTAECRKQDPQTVAGGAGGEGGDGGRGRGFNYQSGSLAGALGGKVQRLVVVVDLLVQSLQVAQV